MRRTLYGSALLAGAMGCSGDSKDPPAPPVDDDTATDTMAITLRFRAEIKEFPFSCNHEYRGVGATSAANIRLSDLRLYVLNPGLTDSTGNTTLLTLDTNAWQSGSLGLLDFEDASWDCVGGTPEINTEITGTVPSGTYTGLAFTIGVPFELNHQEITATTPPPLQQQAMFTGPQMGYRFFKLDMRSDGEPAGYPIHMRSSGCVSDESGVVDSCTSPNRVTFALPSFDPETQDVVLDLAELLSRNDPDNNYATPPPNPTETTPGCQAEPTDPDCSDLFVSYGLSALPPTWIRAE